VDSGENVRRLGGDSEEKGKLPTEQEEDQEVVRGVG
jgi:hypothetical protein